MKSGLTVQEVAERTGLSAHTIRYYERIGLIPSVGRAPNGHRRYTETDVGWIEFLKCLRSTGMPLAEMLRYVALQQEGEGTFQERLALLEAHRHRIKAKIEELNKLLERIEAKINWYRSREVQSG
ncbi:MAG: MerR family transcriptional regulator [Anaerolineae bacterium]|nr:MerR family transcriptional regulator [Anaerolineae bacterium]